MSYKAVKLMVEGIGYETFLKKIISLKCVNCIEVKEMEGQGNLGMNFQSLRGDFVDRRHKVLAILIDSDNKSEKERKEFIQNALENTFNHPVKLGAQNSAIEVQVESYTFQLFYFLMPGNLDKMLHSIRAKKAPHAECFKTSWLQCVEKSGKEISETEIIKNATYIYQCWDCLTQEERKKTGIKASLQYALENNAYNLEHDNLKPLKQFLQKISIAGDTE